MVFEAPDSSDRMLFGVMMSMNEESIPIASRIIAIETRHKNSMDAGIGSIDPSGMALEFAEVASFAHRIVSPERAEKGWADLVALLKADVLAGTLITPQDFQRRGLY